MKIFILCALLAVSSFAFSESCVIESISFSGKTVEVDLANGDDLSVEMRAVSVQGYLGMTTIYSASGETAEGVSFNLRARGVVSSKSLSTLNVGGEKCKRAKAKKEKVQKTPIDWSSKLRHIL